MGPESVTRCTHITTTLCTIHLPVPLHRFHCGHQKEKHTFEASTEAGGPPPPSPLRTGGIGPHIAASRHHLMKILHLTLLAAGATETSSKCSLAFPAVNLPSSFSVDIIETSCCGQYPSVLTTLSAVCCCLTRNSQTSE